MTKQGAALEKQGAALEKLGAALEKQGVALEKLGAEQAVGFGKMTSLLEKILLQLSARPRTLSSTPSSIHGDDSRDVAV